jgi:hypothetical protein
VQAGAAVGGLGGRGQPGDQGAAGEGGGPGEEPPDARRGRGTRLAEESHPEGLC